MSYKGIAEGVENSNFLLHTTRGYYFLTLYEKRVASGDLPFFLGLMAHLAQHGITCPQPVLSRSGDALGKLAGRPAAIIDFLEGVWPRKPNAAHCAAIGRALAQLHLRGRDFGMSRRNALSVDGWRPLFDQAAARADSVQIGLREFLATELDHLEAHWPRGLPEGIIHADLFPDNALFLGDRLSGLIDFYFACNDILAYDVAICLNAWCFEADHSFNVTKAGALLECLSERTRALGGRTRGAAAAGARLGAALPADAARRSLERAAWRAGASEGSARICPQAALPSERPHATATTVLPREHAPVLIHTDGACSGNPGPGGWGAILKFGSRSRRN